MIEKGKKKMKEVFRRTLEKIVFKNKKTFLDHQRSINRASFEGFEEGFRKANEKLIKR